jgi:hypothetical protein
VYGNAILELVTALRWVTAAVDDPNATASPTRERERTSLLSHNFKISVEKPNGIVL